MVIVRNFSVFLLLLSAITLSKGNDEIYDTYFNGHCYWTEEVSYHVHYLSGCKVYFTCQRGKFLDFHRCPESTSFNTKTLQCDNSGICKDDKSVNPTYEAWWKKVVEVIDVVIEALESRKENSQSSDPDRTSRIEKNVSVAIPSSSTEFLEENIKQRDCKHCSADATSHVKGSVNPSLDVESSYCTKELSDSSTVAEVPNLNNFAVQCDANGVCEAGSSMNPEPSHSTATSSETMHYGPAQLETGALKTQIFSSYVTPKALFHEDLMHTIDELSSSYLEAFPFTSNLTKTKNIMSDFIFPIVQDIVKNSTIMSKINQLFDIVFESADPVLYQILDQKVDEESSITLSLKDIKDAWKRTVSQAYPIVKEIIRYTGSLVFGKAAENTEVLLDYLDRDDIKIMENIPSLFGSFLDLVFKYGLFNKPSASDQLTSYPLIEIRKDMNGMFEIVSKMIGKKSV